jgi:hypothetical protein
MWNFWRNVTYVHMQSILAVKYIVGLEEGWTTKELEETSTGEREGLQMEEGFPLLSSKRGLEGLAKEELEAKKKKKKAGGVSRWGNKLIKYSPANQHESTQSKL